MNKLKFLLLHIAFQLIGFSINGQVVIADRFFNIDPNHQLIVVNKDLVELNLAYPGTKTTLIVEGVNYTFETEILTLEKGIDYTILDDQNKIYSLYFTELPIIKIQTDNTILDEPRVHAQLSLCESNGAFLQHDIGVEYRGGSSQVLPKKSLRIEFWNDELGTEKENVELLGMRNDDDWNLEAFYREPLRLRSKLGFDFWRSMDELYYQNAEPEAINAVHQEFVEVFVNGNYQGVYGLSERVDRKQLKLKKNMETEIRGELYKGVDIGVPTFETLPDINNSDTFFGGFEYEYPSDFIEWSNLYDFADFVINRNSFDFYDNYQEKFDLDNAVNYFIYVNLLRALDNTGKNIFIARYDQEEPYFYVPWDLNAIYGIFWNGNLDNFVEGILSNGFYERLINDDSSDGFLERVEARWIELRNDIITTESIVASFTTQFNYLNDNGVYDRESIAWDEYDFGGENEIGYIEQWLDRRIDYLDSFFYDTNMLTKITIERPVEFLIKLYPNPTLDQIQWEVPLDTCHPEKLMVRDARGRFVKGLNLLADQDRLELEDLIPGLYFLSFEFCDGTTKVERVVVK